MSSNRTVLYACLPDYGHYRDRYRMFESMTRLNIDVRLVLLNGAHPPDAVASDNFTPLRPPDGGGRAARRAFLKNLVKQAIRTPAPTVIHDTFMPQLARFAGLRRRKGRTQVRTVLSLYSATPTYLFGAHWLGRSWETLVSWRELPYYLKRYPAVVAREFIGSLYADLVVGNSDSVLHDLQRYYRLPPNRTAVVPSEIDPEFFRPGPSCRAKLQLPDDEHLVLYVGKLQRIKGIDILLRSFDLAVHNGLNARLVLVGEVGAPWHPWYLPVLESLSARNRIEIRDATNADMLRDYYRSADAFVLPTRHEGAPRVAREASACGCPVITSRIPGNTGFDPQGRCTLYADEWSPPAYANLIEKVCRNRDLRTSLSQAGPILAKNHAPEVVAKKYTELYDRLQN